MHYYIMHKVTLELTQLEDTRVVNTDLLHDSEFMRIINIVQMKLTDFTN